ncbi:FlgD immunoglobulin-like domain containing protein [Methanocella arvoryzae]|nr:FlgD immunoglobulin-like domain containing protein [Methanocella arvoryzae]
MVTGSVTVAPAVTKSGAVTEVTYSLANVSGQEYMVYVENDGRVINILNQGIAADGTYYTSWNGKYTNGTNVPDGTYTIKLNTTPYWTTMGS